jgi:hypothetical protein
VLSRAQTREYDSLTGAIRDLIAAMQSAGRGVTVYANVSSDVDIDHLIARIEQAQARRSALAGW